MSKLIAIMGESGAGKTTSMRNLDPKTTMYIDCDKKGLAWKGWREQYNAKAKNYVVTDDANVVAQVLKSVNDGDAYKAIKTLIVDTANGIMVADEMHRMQEKGYDKWADMAFSIWNLLDYSLKMRDDLSVIWVFHSQTDKDDSGNSWTRIRTSGKKLDKLVVESKFQTVLLARCVDGKYVFETRANNSTAKTPMGAFNEATVDNDIAKVLDALKDF